MTATPPERHDAREHRPGLAAILRDLSERAARDQDPVLAFTADALTRLHNLYPDADDLRARGSDQSQARTDIHNTITAALTEHLPAITGLDA